MNSLAIGITQQDIANINEYNRLVGVEGVSSQTAWNRTMLTSSSTAQSLFDNQENLVRSGRGLVLSQEAIANATQTMTIKAKAAEIGLKALSVAGNMLLIMGVSLAIKGIIKGFDALITTTEEHQEQLQNLQQEYDEAKQNLEDVNSQISEYEKRINELQGKTLTPVEEEELQRIQNLNEQLKIEKEVLEEIERIKKGETSDKAIETINSKKGGMTRMEMIEDYAHSGYVNTQKEIDRIMSADYMTSEEKNYEIKYLREHQDSLRQQALEITSELLEEAKALDQNDANAKELYDKIQALSAETLTWAKDVDTATNSVNENSNATSNATKNANKMTVSLSELESASDKIKTLGSAFKELSDDGYITTKTLGEIQTATGLSGDEWSEYESKLLNAKKGSAEFSQIMADLTYKMLDQTFANKDLNSLTEQQISAILRENGVVNADAVAHDWLTKAKETLRIKTALAKASTAEEVVALATEASQAGITGNALNDLILDMGIFNNTNLDVSQKVAALQEMGYYAHWTAQGLASIDKVKKYTINGKDYIASYDGDKLVGIEQEKEIDIPKVEVPKITIPNYSGVASGGSGKGSGSGSDKNEALDNYLKDAENRYKIHQDETKYINDLNYALNNLVKTEDERLDVIGKIDEAYRDLADNRIKDIEHQIELQEKLNGENVNVLEYYDKIQSIASEEADRLRGIGYDDNSNEIQELQNKWWDAQNKKLDFYSKQHENIIRDVEHAMDMATESNPYADTTSFYQQLKDEYHKEAERLRALDPEKYKEEIHELQLAWWEAHNAIVDWRWNNSQNWISDRNTYNDWALFDDSEVDAWERVVKWLKEEYPNDLEKIKEAEQSLFEARKKEFDKANDLGNTYIESQKTLLQSYYDVTNSIAEAQHEINKELETSKTMYEWLDEDTRKLLFNQEDYNVLSEELYDIQYRADKLKRQYERDLENSTLSTVEAITSNYEMQYETLMKSYEIAKADLEIAKKKQKLNNVLNERNVRMFINGQWQWVANTEDVINAKSELADAEYAKRVEESGLAQQQSIDNLTKQQDELGVVIKNFENGVIDLDEAIDLAIGAIGSLPSALSSMYSSAIINSPSYSSGSRRSFNGVQYDSNTDYMSKIQRASTLSEALSYNNQRNAKILGENIRTETLSDSDVENLFKNKHADGTNYTPGGMTLLGEEGFEAYISSNGHLIPIKQPTVGNISSGGIVFNTEQMKNLRTLWDMSNINIDTGGSLLNNSQPRQIDQSQDNRIIIDKLVVDNGSSDGQALVSALRRYIGNH